MDIEKPKISVIMPSLNVKEYIKECVDSVLNQTLKDIEVIFIDGGSTDGTLEILKEYVEKDSRTKLLMSNKKSYGHQVNLGLENATGDYISIIETDDFIQRNMFESLYGLTENSNVDMVKGPFYYYDDSGIEPVITIETIKERLPLHESFTIDGNEDMLDSHPSIWAGIYRKDFLNENDIHMIEAPGGGWVDNPFFFETICLAKRIIYTNKPYYFYRISNPNSSSNKAFDSTIPMNRILDIYKVLEKYDLHSEALLIVFYKRLFRYIEIILENNNDSDENLSFEVCELIQTALKKADKNIVDNKLKHKFQKMYYKYMSPLFLLRFSYKNHFSNEEYQSLNNEIDFLNKEVNSLNKDLIFLNKKYKNLNKDYKNIKKQNKQILNSSSWKITKPLRTFKKIFSKFLKKTKSCLKTNLNYFKETYLHFKSSTPFFSIILPSYNVEDHIDKCLFNLINQRFKNIEIICVDGGSTDNTLKTIEKYIENDSRVKLVKSDKKNYGYQLNLGLEIAKGKYISIIDPKDLIKNEMFKKLFKMTKKFTIDIAKVNYSTTDSNEINEIFLEDYENIHSNAIFKDDIRFNMLSKYPSIWATIFRKGFIQKNNIRFLEINESYLVNNTFYYEAFALTKKINYEDQFYYQHEKNVGNLLNQALNLHLRQINYNLKIIEKHKIKNHNVLVALYGNIFYHIKEIVKDENFTMDKCEISSHIQNFVRSLNKNIINKYLNDKDKVLYKGFLNYNNSYPNILFIPSDNNKTSGAFLSMANLVNILKNKYGLNVKIVLPRKGNGIEVLNALNLKYEIIPSEDWVVPLSIDKNEEYYEDRSLKIEKNKKAVNKLVKFINKHNIDLIHINTTYSYVGALAGQKTNTPVVWHLREFLEEDQSNTLWNRDKGNELIGKSDRIIAISDSILKKYESVFNNHKLVRIYNGIDSNRFYKPEKEIFNEDKVKMIMVGGFEYYKGQIELSKALVKVFQKGYYNFELNFVGVGKEEVRKEVEEIFKEAGMLNLVNFLGYKYDVENYFEKSDISFTCAKSEAFGRTTVEAMLSGNLVIGSNSAGTKELIKDGETGILYNLQDIDDFSEKIIYALNNQENVKKIASNGRSFMYENMTAEKNADNIYRLYQEIFKENYENLLDNYVS